MLAHAAVVGALWLGGRAAAAPPPVPAVDPAASAAMIGESFEVPADLAPDPQGASVATPEPTTATATATTTATTTATATPTTTTTATATATATTTATTTARPPASAVASTSASPSGAPTLYGAVGVRYAVDLLKTFTQSLPQAASADPQWATAPLGGAGEADFTLEIDESGQLRRDVEVHGAPSAALRAGIARTVGLISGRSFTSRTARSRLRINATVTADTHEDEYHGSRFALTGTGSCEGNVCKAFFALPIGRRIDFTLRVLP